MGTLEERRREAERIKRKYDNRVPEIDKKKYLVPSDLTVAQFQYVIRKRIQLDADQAIFICVETMEKGRKTHTLPPTSDSMLSTYNQYKDDDGFLYVTYHGDSTFGAQS